MISTHIDDAQERVDAEQDALDAKMDAVETFIDRVGDISPDSAATAQATTTQGLATATATRVQTGTTTEGCTLVREAFAETIRPHSVADIDDSEPLLATVKAELTDSIAVALAANSNTPLSPGLKRAIVSEAESRRTEIEVMCRTLDSEATLLEEAAESVDEITSWLVEADETPLSEIGFEALQQRHERLAGYREQCEQLAARRQTFLRETTNEAAETGVRHEHIIPQLYEDFPVEYPVLSTASRLEELCQDCQRSVLDHLTRRV